MKIAYFAHDLSDPAVHRRARMLQAGGAELVLIGFRRSEAPVFEIANSHPIDLGRTTGGKLAQRIMQVAAALPRLRRCAPALFGADAYVARNLEMLLLAFRARQIMGGQARITYECLDVHRLQTAPDWRGRLIRRLEEALIGRSQLLLTSSPAFVEEYFSRFRASNTPVVVVENKILAYGEHAQVAKPAERPSVEPPWKIGWFGAIRCRKSLDILRKVADQFGGTVQVVIAGRPTPGVFDDFEKLMRTSPHFRFLGAYRSPEDLAELYGKVHFSWAVDYFEEANNSKWLLPNRLYESGFFGVPSIAVGGTETARWLGLRKIGVILDEPLERSLSLFIEALSADDYRLRARTVATSPRSWWVHDQAACEALVAVICGDQIADVQGE